MHLAIRIHPLAESGESAGAGQRQQNQHKFFHDSHPGDWLCGFNGTFGDSSSRSMLCPNSGANMPASLAHADMAAAIQEQPRYRAKCAVRFTYPCPPLCILGLITQ